MHKGLIVMGSAVIFKALVSNAEETVSFNRAPLVEKPYAELPLGAVRPEGWLRAQLQTMAAGLTGHLDEHYAEVCGDRNAWLGGDGDTWERGPYWIDGLYPLARLLDDKELEAKAMRWIEWTLANQRSNGQIGPYTLRETDRTRPAPVGAQVEKPDDWWPRMVMLKILQQHYMATGDERVIDCMSRYFRYQLNELDQRPLYDPDNPDSGSWWAKRRGGDNVMSVLWLYNITGDSFLLDLSKKLQDQTYPWVDDFQEGEMIKKFRFSEHHGQEKGAYHCVNLAHALKYPAVYYQQSGEPALLETLEKALSDIKTYHGQPHGLWGGDEGMHGTDPTRGSELCTISEAMFSMERVFEITGDVKYADHLEKYAFNPLPTQADEAYMNRQYFQQANQVCCTVSPHKFTNHPYEANVFGLLSGYPCCTCNMHQAWPKLAANLWMASHDGGLAAVAYAPSRVSTTVKGVDVSIQEKTGYPFRDEIRLTVETGNSVEFPLHLRIPEWCDAASIKVNGEKIDRNVLAGTMARIDRIWKHGDTIVLKLPMQVRFERGHENSVTVMRGPLVYVLRMEEEWSQARGLNEVRSGTPWNYSLFERDITSGSETAARKFVVEEKNGKVSAHPWNLKNVPVEIHTYGVLNPLWTNYNEEAGPLPWSPGPFPKGGKPEPITLVPYGCSTLRISAFPTVL